MRLIAMVFAFMLSVSATAFAQMPPGSYFEGTASFTASGDTDVDGWDIPTDSGYLVGFAFGRLLANAISIEAEITYGERDAEDDPITLSALAFMANAYYNFQVANAVAGYFGFGLGGAQLEIDYSGNNYDDFVFAYQAMIGFTYAVNNIILFTEYRYQASQDADFGGTDVEYRTHNFGLGLRMPF